MGDKSTGEGGPPPPSPLTGAYLLIVLPQTHQPQHKDNVLHNLTKGLLTWDKNDCHVDLEKELQTITAQSPEGEEAKNGERLIQFASENLVTEVLIHPQLNTLVQCLRNLLSSFTRHRHIIHAGYTCAGNGAWMLQDGTYSFADFAEMYQEHEVQRVLRAYENTVTVDVHCLQEGDWNNLRGKDPFSKISRVRINPKDCMSSGPALRGFLDYLAPYVSNGSIEELLESSDVVGNIRFSHPTLYVFPGGQGDAALFGINGFNILVDGGFARRACFWDFSRHLDRLDAVLMTRLNNGNVQGMTSLLQRKRMDHVYPQIGHFFCNLQDRKHPLSPDGDKDKDPLLISLFDQGHDILGSLKHLSLKPQACYRDPVLEPINLYHKVGHGKLDMYVISPAKDSREVREFLAKWSSQDSKIFCSFTRRGGEFNFPLSNKVSICALLVWQPANPEDNITRLLFPGSTPQHKIFEGLDKLRNLEFMKHAVCSARTLSPSSSSVGLNVRTLSKPKVPASVEKIIENEEKKMDSVKQPIVKPPTGQVDRPVTKSQPPQPRPPSKQKPAEKPKEKPKTETEVKSEKPETAKIDKPKLDKIEKIEAVQKTEKAKDKPKRPITKQTEKKKPIGSEKKDEKKDSLKSSPTTPKKLPENRISETPAKPDVKSRASSKTKPSPSATPAKSTKEANNRKVLEQKKEAIKKIPPKKEEVKKSEKPPAPKKSVPSPSKVDKQQLSPVKAIRPIKPKPKAEKPSKPEKEGVAETVESTPSTVDVEELVKAKDDAIEKEVKPEEKTAGIEEPAEPPSLSKDEDDEILVVEKIEIEGTGQEHPEESIAVHIRSSREDIVEKEEEEELKAEAPQELITDDKKEIMKISAETIPDTDSKQFSEDVQDLTKDAMDASKSKVDFVTNEDASITKEPTTDKLTPKEKDGKEKSTDINDVKIADESQPDEKFSTTVESGATTAPTLPEDERIPLDEIKEIIEEKHVKEETKEKETFTVQRPEQPTSLPEVAPVLPGLPFDQRVHLLKDIVKTPDEVADLPVHEEADGGIFGVESAQMSRDLQKSKDDLLGLPSGKKPAGKKEEAAEEIKLMRDEHEKEDAMKDFKEDIAEIAAAAGASKDEAEEVKPFADDLQQEKRQIEAIVEKAEEEESGKLTGVASAVPEEDIDNELADNQQAPTTASSVLLDEEEILDDEKDKETEKEKLLQDVHKPDDDGEELGEKADKEKLDEKEKPEEPTVGISADSEQIVKDDPGKAHEEEKIADGSALPVKEEVEKGVGKKVEAPIVEEKESSDILEGPSKELRKTPSPDVQPTEAIEVKKAASKPASPEIPAEKPESPEISAVSAKSPSPEVPAEKTESLEKHAKDTKSPSPEIALERPAEEDIQAKDSPVPVEKSKSDITTGIPKTPSPEVPSEKPESPADEAKVSKTSSPEVPADKLGTVGTRDRASKTPSPEVPAEKPGSPDVDAKVSKTPSPEIPAEKSKSPEVDTKASKTPPPEIPAEKPGSPGVETEIPKTPTPEVTAQKPGSPGVQAKASKTPSPEVPAERLELETEVSKSPSPGAVIEKPESPGAQTKISRTPSPEVPVEEKGSHPVQAKGSDTSSPDVTTEKPASPGAPVNISESPSPGIPSEKLEAPSDPSKVSKTPSPEIPDEKPESPSAGVKASKTPSPEIPAEKLETLDVQVKASRTPSPDVPAEKPGSPGVQAKVSKAPSPEVPAEKPGALEAQVKISRTPSPEVIASAQAKDSKTPSPEIPTEKPDATENKAQEPDSLLPQVQLEKREDETKETKPPSSEIPEAKPSVLEAHPVDTKSVPVVDKPDQPETHDEVSPKSPLEKSKSPETEISIAQPVLPEKPAESLEEVAKESKLPPTEQSPEKAASPEIAIEKPGIEDKHSKSPSPEISRKESKVEEDATRLVKSPSPDKQIEELGSIVDQAKHSKPSSPDLLDEKPGSPIQKIPPATGPCESPAVPSPTPQERLSKPSSPELQPEKPASPETASKLATSPPPLEKPASPEIRALTPKPSSPDKLKTMEVHESISKSPSPEPKIDDLKRSDLADKDSKAPSPDPTSTVAEPPTPMAQEKDDVLLTEERLGIDTSSAKSPSPEPAGAPISSPEPSDVLKSSAPEAGLEKISGTQSIETKSPSPEATETLSLDSHIEVGKTTVQSSTSPAIQSGPPEVIQETEAVAKSAEIRDEVTKESAPKERSLDQTKTEESLPQDSQTAPLKSDEIEKETGVTKLSSSEQDESQEQRIGSPEIPTSKTVSSSLPENEKDAEPKQPSEELSKKGISLLSTEADISKSPEPSSDNAKPSEVTEDTAHQEDTKPIKAESPELKGDTISKSPELVETELDRPEKTDPLKTIPKSQSPDSTESTIEPIDIKLTSSGLDTGKIAGEIPSEISKSPSPDFKVKESISSDSKSETSVPESKSPDLRSEVAQEALSTVSPPISPDLQSKKSASPEPSLKEVKSPSPAPESVAAKSSKSPTPEPSMQESKSPEHSRKSSKSFSPEPSTKESHPADTNIPEKTTGLQTSPETTAAPSKSPSPIQSDVPIKGERTESAVEGQKLVDQKSSDDIGLTDELILTDKKDTKVDKADEREDSQSTDSKAAIGLETSMHTSDVESSDISSKLVKEEESIPAIGEGKQKKDSIDSDDGKQGETIDQVQELVHKTGSQGVGYLPGTRDDKVPTISLREASLELSHEELLTTHGEQVKTEGESKDEEKPAEEISPSLLEKESSAKDHVDISADGKEKTVAGAGIDVDVGLARTSPHDEVKEGTDDVIDEKSMQKSDDIGVDKVSDDKITSSTDGIATDSVKEVIPPMGLIKAESVHPQSTTTQVASEASKEGSVDDSKSPTSSSPVPSQEKLEQASDLKQADQKSSDEEKKDKSDDQTKPKEETSISEPADKSRGSPTEIVKETPQTGIEKLTIKHDKIEGEVLSSKSPSPTPVQSIKESDKDGMKFEEDYDSRIGGLGKDASYISSTIASEISPSPSDITGPSRVDESELESKIEDKKDVLLTKPIDSTLVEKSEDLGKVGISSSLDKKEDAKAAPLSEEKNQVALDSRKDDQLVEEPKPAGVKEELKEAIRSEGDVKPSLGEPTSKDGDREAAVAAKDIKDDSHEQTDSKDSDDLSADKAKKGKADGSSTDVRSDTSSPSKTDTTVVEVSGKVNERAATVDVLKDDSLSKEKTDSASGEKATTKLGGMSSIDEQVHFAMTSSDSKPTLESIEPLIISESKTVTVIPKTDSGEGIASTTTLTKIEDPIVKSPVSTIDESQRAQEKVEDIKTKSDVIDSHDEADDHSSHLELDSKKIETRVTDILDTAERIVSSLNGLKSISDDIDDYVPSFSDTRSFALTIEGKKGPSDEITEETKQTTDKIEEESKLSTVSGVEVKIDGKSKPAHADTDKVTQPDVSTGKKSDEGAKFSKDEMSYETKDEKKDSLPSKTETCIATQLEGKATAESTTTKDAVGDDRSKSPQTLAKAEFSANGNEPSLSSTTSLSLDLSKKQEATLPAPVTSGHSVPLVDDISKASIVDVTASFLSMETGVSQGSEKSADLSGSSSKSGEKMTDTLDKKSSLSSTNVEPPTDKDIPPLSSATASLKAQKEFSRSETPASDILSDRDVEIGHSTPRSDISSGQVSRAVTHVWETLEGRPESQHYESDDDLPGSPMSISSHIPSPPQFEYDMARGQDPLMMSSFYGTLPGDLEEGIKAYTGDLGLVYETGSYEGDSLRKELAADKLSIGVRSESSLKSTPESSPLPERRSQSSASKDGSTSTPPNQATTAVAPSSSTTQAAPSVKDPIAKWDKPLGLPPPHSTDSSTPILTWNPYRAWGKPMGLPSPAPPPPENVDNEIDTSGGSAKTTPKKVSKMNAENNKYSSTIKENKAKRSESPVKKPSGKDRKSGPSPVYMDLSYVPHHGNSNYATVEFFKRVRARYYVFSGTEPSKEVFNALLEAKQSWDDKDLEVTIIPTYDTDTLGYWIAENEEALSKLKIDLSPSASRCTINLQDHDTSCSAYRLEF